MNRIRTRKHLASIVAGISLPVLMAVSLCGGKEEDASQDTREQAAVELVEKTAAVQQNELIDSDGKIKLRILCTTSPKEGRTADFVSFLSRHFVKVETTDYKSFREELADDFDVVIIDYGMTRPGTPTPELTSEYSRATVTLGVAGSMVCRRLRLKPDYL
jgi:CheY-like chemotaxis protein